MKNIFFTVALFATVFVQKTIAQPVPSHREDNQAQLSQVLTSYYTIKDALVAGNTTAASVGASEFLKTVSGLDSKVIAEDKLIAMQKDARAIAQKKDIKLQREHFADLSVNMIAVAKTAKLSAKPVYSLYCPMKKSYWLSNDKTIKNPYYGSAMLTCGTVSETISQ